VNTPTMQFGTSRFLQAHADLFISDAMEKGAALGPVTVVQTTGSADRAERLQGLAIDGGFPVRIRGIEHGEPVDRTQYVKSVRRALSAAADWEEIKRIFIEEVELVLCNTADRGYDVSGESVEFPAGLPTSFPGKLTALLHARFRANGAPLTVLPCELISKNGEVLRGIIDGLAQRWYADHDFDTWIEEDVIFCNTLVDRIVSEALSPAGAVAEPYALWAIQRVARQTLPCTHPAIVVTDDIAPFEQLKLFILNLGHTVLANRWIEQGRAENLTVREILAGADTKGFLLTIYQSEVVPGFAARQMGEEAEAYVRTTMDRFENPFLDHRLSDIAQNHREKVVRRIEGFMTWSGAAAPKLSAILAAAHGA
jgi:tagaturonate reductase